MGAVLGMAMASQWKIRPPALVVSRRKSQIATLMATMIVVVMWMKSSDPPSVRGVILPGRLEAHWKLDESSGRIAQGLVWPRA